MFRLFTKSLSLILVLSVFFTFSVSPALAAVTYLYDANGNMTSDGEKCYQYNEANQLDKVTKCSNGQTIAEYIYDYSGTRLVKKEFENGVLKKTVYSPADEYETVKQATSGATANTSYYKANDETIAKKNPDGTITYYHNDHLGSSAVLANQTGALVEKTTFEPYGEVKSGGTKSKFGYTGQEQDNETGLNYYNARYYDPHIQRFTQPDTWLPDIYDPQQLNRYSYVKNNPLRYTDPSGHQLAYAAAGTGAIFLGGAAALGTIPVIPILVTVGIAAAIFGTWQYFNTPKATEIKTKTQDTTTKSSTTTSTTGKTGGGNTGGGKTGGGNTGGTSGGGSPQGQNPIGDIAPILPLLPQSKGQDLNSGVTTVNKALDLAGNWLGKGYKEIGNGNGVFRSADNLRQFRISNGCLNQCYPHVHFQSIGTNGEKIFETGHVYLLDMINVIVK